MKIVTSEFKPTHILHTSYFILHTSSNGETSIHDLYCNCKTCSILKESYKRKQIPINHTALTRSDDLSINKSKCLVCDVMEYIYI